MLELPATSVDPIIRLHDYYFQPADMLYVRLQKILLKLSNKKSNKTCKLVDTQCTMQLWLATLYVVIEGFQNDKVKKFYKHFNLRDNDMDVHFGSIQHMSQQLGDELKRYRNVTFHFQESQARIENLRSEFFISRDRHHPLEWATDLHKEIACFFSQYRPAAAAAILLEHDRKLSSNQ